MKVVRSNNILPYKMQVCSLAISTGLLINKYELTEICVEIYSRIILCLQKNMVEGILSGSASVVEVFLLYILSMSFQSAYVSRLRQRGS